jgi:hypothetical protein
MGERVIEAWTRRCYQQMALHDAGSADHDAYLIILATQPMRVLCLKPNEREPWDSITLRLK